MQKELEMNKIIKHFIPLLSLSAILGGCGDDSLFDEEGVSTIKQEIFIVPERYTKEPYTIGFQPHPIYLEADQVVKFWATYVVDDHYINTDLYDNYIAQKIWDVDGEYFNLNSFRYSFSEPGYKKVTLKSIDLMGDTITENLDIYVNTPISASLVYPPDGFNLVDPISEEGVDLLWNVSGIDEWENSTCVIYMSYSENDIWKHPQTQGWCNEPAHVIGPIADDIPGDSAETIYWAVVATNYSGKYFSEVDSSPVFKFTTKFAQSDSAQIILPISYTGLWGNASVETTVRLLSATGDTLGTFTSPFDESDFVMKVIPQTGLRIFATENNRQEFKADTMIVDVPAAAQYSLDTLFFTDDVAPVVIPTNDAFDSSSMISFFAIDNGSGLNINHIIVTSGTDTIETHYSGSIISFNRPHIFSYRYVKVSVQDNAKNHSADVYWKMTNNGDSIKISGPYADEGGD